MLGTRPRRIASSAISRWLQWLIGRSLSDGFSQVIAITAQICSGVYVAGAPERGASASRSGTHWAGCARRQRPRQYRTVFGHTPSSRALSRTPISSTACNIMRARTANCCEVEWARTTQLDNTHGTGFRELLYRWHPWFGLPVFIHQSIDKPGDVVFRCTLGGFAGARWWGG